jgi:REP-associated tyrosine transposase
MMFFNPFEDIRITRHNLPHWQQSRESGGGCCFCHSRSEAEYHRLFSARVDQWLDQGPGSCVLRQPSLRGAVEESLKFFNGQRYELLAYVIMPNHDHVLFVLHPDWPLEKVLFTWKRRTAGVINETLGVEGQFWQHDYFDRLIRDGDHLRNVIRYIRRNPTKAHLKEGEFSLWKSEMAQAVE